MPTLLHVNACSRPRGQSRSLRVGDAFIEGWKSAHKDGVVHEEVLFKEELAMQDATDTNARISNSRGVTLDAEQKQRFSAICSYIEPLKAADVVLITTPMWNFGPPWKLKQWIDTVTQAKVTFEYTPQGPRGMLTAKGAIVGSSGGAYKDGDPRETHNFLTPYLQWALSWMGVKDAPTCFAWGLDANREKAEQIVAEACEKARKLGAGM